MHPHLNVQSCPCGENPQLVGATSAWLCGGIRLNGQTGERPDQPDLQTRDPERREM